MITIAVIEDLVMALYLPFLAALLLGADAIGSILAGVIAIAVVIAVLAIALRLEVGLSRVVFSRSDEALLLSILGFAFLIAGLAEVGKFSAAVGALLAGIILSGPAARSAQTLVRPLRDLFAAFFFAFIGLSIDPSTIPPVLGWAVLVGTLTTGTKLVTGWWAGRSLDPDRRARAVVGAALVPRGEFALAIAGLAAGGVVEDSLGPFTVTYVIFTIVVGSVLTRVLANRADRASTDAAAIHG